MDFGLEGGGVMEEIAGLGGKSGKDACREEKKRLELTEWISRRGG